jgi:DNA-directed RNA polymerase specialized sigma24 family protein
MKNKTYEREEFDKWFADNFNKLANKYTLKSNRAYNKERIKEVLSDFYLGVIVKEKYKEINDYSQYLNTYMFNQLVQYKSEAYKRVLGYMENKKSLKIKVMASLPTESNINEWVNDQEAKVKQPFFNEGDEVVPTDMEMLMDVFEVIKPKLNLHEQKLLELILKGTTQRKIAEERDCTERTINSLVQVLKLKIQALVEEELNNQNTEI